MPEHSKSLGHSDKSGEEYRARLLDGDTDNGIFVDAVLYNEKHDKFTLVKIDEEDTEKNFGVMQQLLDGEFTMAVNPDILLYNEKQDKWTIIELCLCSDKQVEKKTTPWNSHPNNYPDNWKKFMSLNRLKEVLSKGSRGGCDFFIMNYCIENSLHGDKHLVLKVTYFGEPHPQTGDFMETGVPLRAGIKKAREWYQRINRNRGDFTDDKA